MDLNSAWSSFLDNTYNHTNGNRSGNGNGQHDYLDNHLIDNTDNTSIDVPICGDIYISTKTKILYLNQEIQLANVFWKIPIMEYSAKKEGVVKKQMKFNSLSKAELDVILNNINDKDYVDQHIIQQIINPNGRIKFKDTRKISIGLSRKDIISYRCKKKSAFYNCFVMILRINIHKDTNKKPFFKELHVKVFNTGKLEIPGIQDDKTLIQLLNVVVKVLSPIVQSTSDNCTPLLDYLFDKTETVLINSNFNCGFYINREKLYTLLKYQYKINSNYDACSYPGIQSKFYHVSTRTIQNGHQPNDEELETLKETHGKISTVSFMIFRTGSILIVGKCTEDVLYEIYDFLKIVLQENFHDIYTKIIDRKQQQLEKERKEKKKKRKKKKLTILQ